MPKESPKTTAAMYKTMLAVLNEKQIRLFAAFQAELLGRGGKSEIAKRTGLSRVTIDKGISDFKNLLTTKKPELLLDSDVRKQGGGRKSSVEKYPDITAKLEFLLDAYTTGNPEKVLLYSFKSTRTLSRQLQRYKIFVSPRTIDSLLWEMGYSLQSNHKAMEGGNDPDRDVQFKYINRKSGRYIKSGQPVISVDCKKKELVGAFKNAGRHWRPSKNPKYVNVYDFIDKQKGKATPYGIYDMVFNEGFVNVGISHDTAEFAVSSIRQWWLKMGRKRYPKASQIYINADGGGSNGSRNKLWKMELQRFADEFALEVSVSHLPPGTSKWNKIEHRMFSFISRNWEAEPLVSFEVIINLIAATTTRTGLKIKARKDSKIYDTGIKVEEEDLERLNMTNARFHGEWNYTISPS